ncbi:hypothetical protein HDU76_001919 [Blyttiomyces sp. JEL0837]|nr:hypothetical protein HDU76_001919 [Blyttiomyces sp. JEL0837]
MTSSSSPARCLKSMPAEIIDLICFHLAHHTKSITPTLQGMNDAANMIDPASFSTSTTHNSQQQDYHHMPEYDNEDQGEEDDGNNRDYDFQMDVASLLPCLTISIPFFASVSRLLWKYPDRHGDPDNFQMALKQALDTAQGPNSMDIVDAESSESKTSHADTDSSSTGSPDSGSRAKMASFRNPKIRARHYLASIRSLNLYRFSDTCKSLKTMSALLPFCTGLRQLKNVSEDYITLVPPNTQSPTGKHSLLPDNIQSLSPNVDSLSCIALTPSSLEACLPLLQALTDSHSLLSRIKTLSIETQPILRPNPPQATLDLINAISQAMADLLSSAHLRLVHLRLDGDPVSNIVVDAIARTTFASKLRSLVLAHGSWTRLAPLRVCESLRVFDILGPSSVFRNRVVDDGAVREPLMDPCDDISVVLKASQSRLRSLSIYSFRDTLDDRFLKSLCPSSILQQPTNISNSYSSSYTHQGTPPMFMFSPPSTIYRSESHLSPLEKLRIVDTPCNFSEGKLTDALYSWKGLKRLIFSPTPLPKSTSSFSPFSPQIQQQPQDQPREQKPSISLNALVTLPNLRTLYLEHVHILPLSLSTIPLLSSPFPTGGIGSGSNSSTTGGFPSLPNSPASPLPPTNFWSPSLQQQNRYITSTSLEQITLRDVGAWHHLIDALCVVDEGSGGGGGDTAGVWNNEGRNQMIDDVDAMLTSTLSEGTVFHQHHLNTTYQQPTTSTTMAIDIQPLIQQQQQPIQPHPQPRQIPHPTQLSGRTNHPLANSISPLSISTATTTSSSFSSSSSSTSTTSPPFNLTLTPSQNPSSQSQHHRQLSCPISPTSLLSPLHPTSTSQTQRRVSTPIVWPRLSWVRLEGQDQDDSTVSPDHNVIDGEIGGGTGGDDGNGGNNGLDIIRAPTPTSVSSSSRRSSWKEYLKSVRPDIVL